VEWLPFDLHPEYPAEGIPRSQLLARYGDGMTEHVRGFFAARGLEYNPHPEVVPNSLLALRLTELAREHGRHGALHDRLMDAYWAEARNIGDPDVLREEAAAAGLAAEDVEALLAGERYRDRVEASTREAHALGVNAVPAFVLDRRLLVLGAQPLGLFEQAFARLDEV
jgi:predicted DsbA family dithiol-disulfide isomerase